MSPFPCQSRPEKQFDHSMEHLKSKEVIFIGPLMNVIRKLLKNRVVIVLLALCLILIAWEGYKSYAAGFKIPDDLKQAMEKNRYVNVTVFMDFAPEEFHINYFQSKGQVAGIFDDCINLYRVRKEQIKEIARQFWVTEIKLVGEE